MHVSWVSGAKVKRVGPTPPAYFNVEHFGLFGWVGYTKLGTTNFQCHVLYYLFIRVIYHNHLSAKATRGGKDCRGCRFKLS